MKAVVVVALLALCAFAFDKSKVDAKNIKVASKMAPVRDAKNFTPVVNDCAFTAKLRFYDASSLEKIDEVKGYAYLGGEHTALELSGEIDDEKFEYKRFRRADVTSGYGQMDVETLKAAGERVCYYTYHDTSYYYNGVLSSMFLPSVQTDPTLTPEILTSTFYYYDDPVEKEIAGRKMMVYTNTYGYIAVEDNMIAAYYFPAYVPYVVVVDDYEEGATKGDFSASSKYEDEVCTEEKIFEDPADVPATCELDDAASTVKAIAALVLAMMVLFF